MRIAHLHMVLAIGAMALATARPARGDGPAPEFARFIDRYFEALYTYFPSDGTAQGFHEYDAQCEDMSSERHQRRIDELKRQLAELQRFERSKLTFDDAIDAEFLEGQLRHELMSEETLETWRRNPMIYAGFPGNAVDGLIKRDFAPAPERLRAVIARERLIPKVFVDARANLTNPPRVWTELALRLAQGSVGFFEGSVAAWAHDAAGPDDALKRDFDAANAQVIAALRDYAAWLESDLLPRSNGAFALGEARFLELLEHREMIALPLAELRARAEAQLERDRAAFIATAKAIDPAAPATEVIKRLTENHPTAEDLIPAVRRSFEAAQRFVIDRRIVTIPSDVPPTVEETPPYSRAGTFASMDTPGAYETRATEAYYYVTPVEPDWDDAHKEEHLRAYSFPALAILNVHEAYPGHYLQFLYAPRLPTKARKLLYCTSNVEGWAHYTEQMMVDEGFGDGDPKVRLAQLHDALLRDCRYVAAILLHAQGASVEDAARVFVERGFQEPANALAEAKRGTYDPTYLAYTFGKIEIYALRDEYKARKGGTLKDFHDDFVKQGGLPLPLIRKVLFRD